MPRKNSKPSRNRKEPTTHASAVAVLEFMQSGKAPDFLYTVIKEAIEHACDHLDPHRESYPDYADPYGITKDHLIAVFKRMRIGEVRLQDMEDSAASLARHIKAVYDHPLTPVRLWNDIGDFVTDGSNLRVSEDPKGDTLLSEWTGSTATIARIIELANKYDKAEDASDAN